MYTLDAARNTVADAPHVALEECGLPYAVNWVEQLHTES